VLAGNFLLLIVGWAFVGAASYMLISFWYRRATATRAGLKAFVINVVGDVGLVLGTFLLFKHTGTVDFLKTFHEVRHVFAYNSPDLVAACLLLLVGAFAKSAQVPLHTWLPDAMEGPTPVSALIHAATMVTAGVYLIARMHPLFEHATTAADVGAIGGCLTLLIAATIAIVQTDIKRVIAYSTMSQIGYMIMAVCVGAYTAGLFHLMTHAFFKALLFMAAGSIIGAMAGVQSLDRMGGFRRALPFTFACFLIGGLALSGMPPFSGWLSKDDILGYLDHRGGGFEVLGIAGYLGAFLTGIYTFRMIFRAFFGEPVEEARELEQGHLAHADVPRNPLTGEEEDSDIGFPGPGHYIAEREWPMKIAMGTLAVLAIVGGVIQIPGIDDVLTRPLVGRLGDRRRDRDCGDRCRLQGVGRRSGHRHGAAGPVPGDPRLPRPQVVLRRADRRRGGAAGAVVRPVRRRGARANPDRRRHHRRHGRRGSRRLGGGPPGPDGVRALLRRRDDRVPLRRGPLLPDLEHVRAA
jgi:NADH-quinone oxidoreductase subunit L